MNKEEVLSQIRSAKASHVSWVQKAKFLIEGFPTDKESIPKDATLCKFGTWFYSDGQRLNVLKNNPQESMAKVEELHMNLHDHYLDIYKIYYSVGETGFFGKLLGRKKAPTEESKKIAKEYFAKLGATSKELIEELNRMERRIIAVKEEDFVKL